MFGKLIPQFVFILNTVVTFYIKYFERTMFVNKLFTFVGSNTEQQIGVDLKLNLKLLQIQGCSAGVIR